MNRVAIVQITASTDKKKNLKAAGKYIQEAKDRGSRLVVFPEFLMAYSPSDQSAQELCELAETLDGPFAQSLIQIAKSSRVFLVATIYEKSKQADRVYDTALLIDAEGSLIAAYRKLHLYDALGFRESDKLVAADDLVKPIPTDLGTIGMMICYDLRFPELSRILSLMGADLLIAPSAWVQGEMKIEHWQTMVQARAIENGSYVIAPNQTGNIYIGHSMVVDPFGRVVLEMGVNEGVETVDVDITLVAETREKLPLLQNRRPNLYSKYLRPRN